MVAVSEAGAIEMLQESLFNNGNEFYLPKVRERVVKRGRRYWREAYLFGRYALVRIAGEWWEVPYLRGVSEVLVMPTGEPSVVKDRVVDQIKMREVDGYVRLDSRFARGQGVRVTEGPLLGLSGKYEGVGRTNYDVVFLNMLGGWTRAEVPSASIASIG